MFNQTCVHEVLYATHRLHLGNLPAKLFCNPFNHVLVVYRHEQQRFEGSDLDLNLETLRLERDKSFSPVEHTHKVFFSIPTCMSKLLSVHIARHIDRWTNELTDGWCDNSLGHKMETCFVFNRNTTLR